MEYSLVLIFVLFFVAITILVTWLTTKYVKTAADFYVTGNKTPWILTGIAMVGSYLSAASFLGVSGGIAIFGVDKIWIAIGFFGGYMAVLLLIAGPLRNVGSYTVADAFYARFPAKEIKLWVMICTLVISIFYLVPQILGAGLLFELLLKWDFLFVIISIGVLICIYIIFGGMKATIYNQVIQASFLFGIMVFLAVLGLIIFVDGSFTKLITLVSEIVPPSIAGADPSVASAVSLAPDAKAAIDVARQILPDAPSAMTIGVHQTGLIAQISTVIALVFGTAGLPHILIMFYTVPSAKAAKKSVMLCVVGLGIFYISSIILGFLLMPAIYPQLVAWIAEGNVGFAKNMSVLTGANAIGGQVLMALAAAAAVAAILSTAAGLMIACASTVSNDLYRVYINKNATEKQELNIAKITTVVVASISVGLAYVLKHENVAWLVTLGFGIAASAIFPAMVSNLWWRKLTRQGAIAGIASGLIVSLIFIIALLSGVNTIIGLPTSGGPGVFGVVVSFIVLIVVSKFTKDTGTDVDKFFATAHKPDEDM
ncbi:MAG: cation acetate symporter [Cyanobacteriota bacterium]